MTNSGQVREEQSQKTIKYYNAYFEELEKNLTQEKESKQETIEARLSGACFILRVDLKDILAAKGVSDEEKSNARKKLAVINYRSLQKQWHPDKNRDALVEADKLAKLVNSARDILFKFIDGGCLLTQSEATSETKETEETEKTEEKFWQKFYNLQKKYKRQYTLVTSPGEQLTADTFIKAAKSLNKKYRLIKNWDIKSKESSEEKKEDSAQDDSQYSEFIEVYTNKRATTDMEVFGPAVVELYGPDAFFEMFTTGSILCKFDKSHLEYALEIESEESYKEMSQEEKIRYDEFIKKCLNSDIVISAIRTSHLIALATQGTKRGIVDIGRTSLDVFIYYLQNNPEAIDSNKIKQFFKLTPTNKKAGEYQVEVVDTLLNDPSILYGLSDDALVAIMEASGSQEKRVAATILTDPVLANKLSDDFDSESSNQNKVIQVLLKNEPEDTIFLYSHLKNIIFGNKNSWQNALSDEMKKNVSNLLERYKNKQYSPETLTLYETIKPHQIRYQNSPEANVAECFFTQYLARDLQHFDASFLLNEFGQDHYQIFHLNLAKHLINLNRFSDAYDLLNKLRQTFAGEEKTKASVNTQLDKDILTRLYEEVEYIAEQHKDAMINKYLQHIKIRFIEYIKNPYTDNRLSEFRRQFYHFDKGSEFDELVQSIEKSVQDAQRRLVFGNKPSVILDDLILDDHNQIKAMQLKLFDTQKDEWAILEDRSCYNFLLNKIREFSGLSSDNQYADQMKEYFDNNSIQISTFIDIQNCFIRLKGKHDGIQEFTKLMSQYSPGVTNFENPQQEIKKTLLNRLHQLAVSESTEILTIKSLESAFEMHGLKHLFIAGHQHELKIIRERIDKAVTYSEFKKLLDGYYKIKLQDESNTLLDLEISCIGIGGSINELLNQEIVRSLRLKIKKFIVPNQPIEKTLNDMKEYLHHLTQELRGSLPDAIIKRDAELKRTDIFSDKEVDDNQIQAIELVQQLITQINFFLPKDSTIRFEEYTEASRFLDMLDEIANKLDYLHDALVSRRNSESEQSTQSLAMAYQNLYALEQEVIESIEAQPQDLLTQAQSVEIKAEEKFALSPLPDSKTASPISLEVKSVPFVHPSEYTKLDHELKLIKIQNEFKIKSLLNEYESKPFGRLLFIFTVFYDDKTKAELKELKQKFEVALDDYVNTFSTYEEKRHQYQLWQKSPVVQTHRETGIYALGSTATSDHITDKINNLKK